MERDPSVQAREKDVIERDGSSVACRRHVSNEFRSEMPFSQPRLEPSHEDMVGWGLRVFELDWGFDLTIRAGVFVPDLVLDRWTEKVGFFRIEAGVSANLLAMTYSWNRRRRARVILPSVNIPRTGRT